MTLEDRLRDTLASENPAATPINPRDVIGTARQRQRRRWIASASALVVAAVSLTSVAIAAGPWRDSPKRVGTTVAAPGAGQTGEAAAVATYRAQLEGWVGCLRQNGAQVDPVGDDIDAFFTGLSQFKGQPSYEKAAQACASKLPVVTDEVERAFGNTPASPQQMQKYARCMHEHGATRFPTPGASGLTPQQSGDWLAQPLSASELEATQACGPISEQ